jgi:selenocysteine lyase/cysteine desulfurase
MDWTSFRSQFPALEDRAYLNTAGGGVMSYRVARAGQQYYQEALEKGDTAWDEWLERAELARNDVALFVGAAAHQIAFLQNASLGLNIVARSLGPLDSRGESARVLAIDKEFPSCTTPFIRAGWEVKFMPTDSTGYVDADMLLQNLDPRPRAFVLSSVQYANGFRSDIRELGRICRKNDVLFIVDATQSIGAFPINLEDDYVDALIFSGYKWATAGYGVAVLATGFNWPEGDPPLVGWRSARNAYALENNRLDLLPTGIGHEMGHPAFPGIFSMGEALRSLSEVGVENVKSRILSLMRSIRSGLQELDVPIRSHSSVDYGSGILLIDVQDAAGVCTTLREQSVWTTARDGGLRVSAHGYNSVGDIERFLTELGIILRSN